MWCCFSFLWKSSFPEATDVEIVEKFVIMMYDKSSTSYDVNEARMAMFAKNRGHMMPFHRQKKLCCSTLNELHTLLAAYGVSQHSVYQRKRAHLIWDGKRMVIYWTALSAIAESCQQLTKCGCKVGCHGRCRCNKIELSCTALCS